MVRRSFYDSQEYKDKQRERTLKNRELYQTNEYRKKLSDIARQRWTNPEFRVAFSQRMKEAVKDHPQSYSSRNVSGRTKMVEFDGKIFKGTWELDVAKYLKHLSILFEQPTTPFDYSWNGSIHKYFPDFFLPEYETYLEVKGYQRERDLAKWAVVPKLIVIAKKEIDEIRTDRYDLLGILARSSMVEPTAHNGLVVGSIPTGPTIRR